VFATQPTQRRHLPTPVDEIDQQDLIEETENIKNTELVGCCVIGAVSYPTKGLLHWKQMVQNHGRPVLMWHRLSKPSY
jgi:hypothetical protein